MVDAVRFGCAVDAALVCDEAGSFGLEATTRGRVTDEAVCDDAAPVCDVDLSRAEFVLIDGEFVRRLFPAEPVDLLLPGDLLLTV